MLETSRYFKAVPVYLPTLESPKRQKGSQVCSNQNVLPSPRSQSSYFIHKHYDTPDVRIKQLRSNNPFNKPIPGEQREMKPGSYSMYGEEEPPKFKPTRALVDFQNPFQRKALVPTNQDTTTSFLRYISASPNQRAGSPRYPHNPQIDLDDFPLNLNDQESSIDIAPNVGSRIPLQRTPVFNPTDQSYHDDIDLQELEKQLNFNGETFKLVNLKRATKL